MLACSSRSRAIECETTLCWRSFHQGEIPPEVHQTVSAAEERGEVCRVHEHDVSDALLVWRHPEQAVELRIAGRGEGMRTVGIDRLAGQQMDRLAVFFGNCVVRQMRMEVQCRNVLEQAELVNVPKRGERRELLCAFDYRRTQAVEYCGPARRALSSANGCIVRSVADAARVHRRDVGIPSGAA